MESVFRSKFDQSLIMQIVNQVSLKKDANTELKYAKWKVNGQNIEVSSETGSDTLPNNCRPLKMTSPTPAIG